MTCNEARIIRKVNYITLKTVFFAVKYLRESGALSLPTHYCSSRKRPKRIEDYDLLGKVFFC